MSWGKTIFIFLGFLWLWPWPNALAESPGVILTELDAYPHAVRISHQERAVIDREIGLGALEKVRGSWRFKSSERLSGQLLSYTWQIVDGFSSNEVLAGVEARLEEAQLLFSCDGRSCGRGVQWANGVFGERVLYGRDDLQRYRVYDPLGDGKQRLLFFSTARTSDRQYLHAELLTLKP